MKELPKAYEAKQYENSIYKIWEESGFFNPDNLPGNGESFTISMPPANVTGVLHIGHATFVTLQDLMVRFARMQGKKALWLPGTDHASIATQNIVEKKIWEEDKKTRFDFSREKFIEIVSNFAEKSQVVIKSQIRSLGASCDWSRERYTLDTGLTKSVNEAFIRLYNNGLIYRGKRMVNWCTRCGTTLADDEVEYKESINKFYYLKYGPLIIGTARPETKVLDKVAIVHPDDERYKQYVGREFTIPWILGDIKIKVVADKMAEIETGTGAMSITPAHSFVDFELAQKYDFEIVDIIGPDGKLTGNTGRFSGLKAKEARVAIIEELQAKGLVDRIDENYKHNLSICYRCGMPIEPMPLEQWFVAVDKPFKMGWFKKTTLKKLALEAVRSGQIKIIPEKFEKVYYNWMENLHDWCISRQIWFGHRIPVWYREKVRKSGSQEVKDDLNNKEVFVGAEKPEEKTNFVFLHGFYATLEVKDPLKWLYEQLPGANNFWSLLPGYDKSGSKEVQIKYVLDHATIDENTVIVTHSRGGKLAMKLLEETGRQVKGLVLIVAGIGGRKIEVPDSGEYDSFDFKKIKSLVKTQIVLFEATEDHVRAPEAYQTLARELNAKHIKAEKSASHYNQAEASEVLEELKKFIWVQDPDTLDTWFSSSLWTFSTLGWPDQTIDLKTFHPTEVLETSYDILFFWVARMILMSKYLLRQVPFKTVYLHGLVRDKQGRKMSKSLGNGIDPLLMIGKYGADATRLALMIGTTPGNDVRMYEEKIAGYRNFINKLWNISRFILMNVTEVKLSEVAPTPVTTADRWILSRLSKITKEVTEHIEKFEFSPAGEKLYDFTWHELADWYVEIAKIEGGKDAMLSWCLQTILKLWHPFTPFVTEVLWGEIFNTGKMLMVEFWPKIVGQIDEKAEAEIKMVQEIVTVIRNFRSENKVLPDSILNCTVSVKNKDGLSDTEIMLIEGLRTKVKVLHNITESSIEIKVGDYIINFSEALTDL